MITVVIRYSMLSYSNSDTNLMITVVSSTLNAYVLMTLNTSQISKSHSPHQSSTIIVKIQIFMPGNFPATISWPHKFPVPSLHRIGYSTPKKCLSLACHLLVTLFDPVIKLNQSIVCVRYLIRHNSNKRI